MSFSRRLKSIPLFLVIGLVLSLVTHPHVAAQASEFTSASNGATITWSNDWEIGTEHSDQSLGIDGLSLEAVSGNSGLNFIFTADQFNREEVREALLSNLKQDADDYKVIDSGDYDNLAYELSSIEVANGKVGSFILVLTGTGTTAVHIVAPIDDFAESVAKAQGSVQLNQSPVLQGIDGESLQAQLEVAPEAGSKQPSPKTSTETNSSETSSSSKTSSSASDQSYTEPTWGYTVNYPGEWSDQSMGIGDLDLINSTPTIVSFMGIDNPGVAGTVIEGALLPTFMDVLGPNGTFIASSSNAERAVFVGETDGMVMIQELIIVSPGVVVIVTAVVAIGQMDAELPALQQITINGKRILSLL